MATWQSLVDLGIKYEDSENVALLLVMDVSISCLCPFQAQYPSKVFHRVDRLIGYSFFFRPLPSQILTNYKVCIYR